jgi:hypothetical protein
MAITVLAAPSKTSTVTKDSKWDGFQFKTQTLNFMDGNLLAAWFGWFDRCSRPVLRASTVPQC